MSNNSTITITNTFAPLTDAENIMFRTNAPTIKLNELVADVGITAALIPVNVVERLITRPGEKDLTSYVVITADGGLYSTASAGCIETLLNILRALEEIDGVGKYAVEFSRVPSRKGNPAMLCRLIPRPVDVLNTLDVTPAPPSLPETRTRAALPSASVDIDIDVD